MPTLLANRYQVLRQLGRGGMGIVYAVADTLEADRQLALKTIRQDSALTPHQRLRFKEEFRAMARLEHPNTVKVHDFGVLDAHSHFLTMEIVPGHELSELISDRGMPIDQACRLLIQLLQALGFIHARGYIHRDIKSQNIRVTAEGVLKLMDFGLMEPVGQGGTRTITGTPGYLPPEVVTGGPIGPAADLYSVGCLAMEMLTGKLPFSGTLSEVVRAHAGTPPEPLRARRPELPEALERIVTKLLRKDPASRYAGAGEVVADLAGIVGLEVALETQDQRRSYVRTSELVGREQELSSLEAAMAGLKQRQSAALLIGAPAGVGKSRLLEELLLLAKLEGVTVLKGRSDDTAQAPYHAVGQALKPLMALASDADRTRHDRAIACLSGTATEEFDQECLEGAIWDALEEAAERSPLLWLMEDVHWADARTLALLNMVIRRLAGQPIMIVATFRDDEVGPASPIWHTLEDGTSRLLRLGPLGREEQRQMLQAMLGPLHMIDGFESALYQATGGNAFFLSEVVRMLLEEGQIAQREGVWHFPVHPDVLGPLQSIQATVSRRVDHLSPGARALAAAAAVIGSDQDLAMLLAVSCFDEEVFFARLEELIARQFIVKTGDRHAFPHSRIREALYERLEEPERRLLHQRAGEYLEEITFEGPGPVVHQLAHHFAAGQDPARAYRYCLKAGDAADTAGADALALAHWQRADLALEAHERPDKPAMQVALWRRIAMNGLVLSTEAALAAMEKLAAAQRAEPAGDPLELGGLLSMLAGARALAGDARGSLAAAEEAAALAPEDDLAWGATLRSAVTLPLLLQGRFDEMCLIADEAIGELSRLDLSGYPYPVRMGLLRALGGRSGTTYQGIKPDPGVGEATLVAAQGVGDHSPLLAPSLFGLHAAWSGHQAQAQRYIDDTLQLCRRIGAPPYQMVLYLQPYMLWQRGDLQSARAQLDKARSYPHIARIITVWHHVLALDAELKLDAGDAEGARSAFRALGALAAPQDLHLSLLMAWIGEGRAAIALGDSRGGQALLERALTAARTGPGRNPRQAMFAGRALGELATTEGRFADAVRHLEAAIAIAEDPAIDMPIESAHGWRLLGDQHKAAGDRASAHRAWREAGKRYHALTNMHGLSAITRRLEGLTGRLAEPEREEATVVAKWRFMGGGV